MCADGLWGVEQPPWLPSKGGVVMGMGGCALCLLPLHSTQTHPEVIHGKTLAGVSLGITPLSSSNKGLFLLFLVP